MLYFITIKISRDLLLYDLIPAEKHTCSFELIMYEINTGSYGIINHLQPEQ